jgi:hypothetical protein
MPEPEHERSNGDRATVALVDAKVDTIRELVKGGFENVQRQLNEDRETFKRVEPALTSLRERMLYVETRVTDLEEGDREAAKEDRDTRRFRRSDLPGTLIGLGLFAIALVQALH